MPNLLDKYQKEVIPIFKKEFGVTSSLAIPRIVKVVVNIGLKEGVQGQTALEKPAEELAAITGQKPSIRRAKKSIAGFKLVKGNPIGLMVTLRGKRMLDFLDKLFNIVFPRIRDFRGLPLGGFDGRGNYSLGIEEQLVFPEVSSRKIEKVKGLEITIVTNAGTNEKAKRLLELLGMPFKQVQSSK